MSKPPGSDFGAPPRSKRVRLDIGYEGPVLRPTPNPPWADNEPAPEGARTRCLHCREPVARAGLCEEPACFWAFWERRLQAQGGRWRRRDIPKVWRDTVFREFSAWREWA